MLRLSVLTALTTAEIFVGHLPTTTAIARSNLNLTIPAQAQLSSSKLSPQGAIDGVLFPTAQVRGANVNASMPHYNLNQMRNPRSGFNGTYVTATGLNATQMWGAGSSSLSTTTGTGTEIAALGTKNVSAASVNNTIPDTAAEGLGLYVNQIAARLAAADGASNSTALPFTAASSDAKAVGYGSIKAGFGDAMGGGAFGMALFSPAPVDRPGLDIGNQIRDSEGRLSQQPSNLRGAAEPSPRAFAQLGAEAPRVADTSTAASPLPDSRMNIAVACAGGGVLGIGAIALYARSRNNPQTELSRYGQAPRPYGSELPRRFRPA